MAPTNEDIIGRFKTYLEGLRLPFEKVRFDTLVDGVVLGLVVIGRGKKPSNFPTNFFETIVEYRNLDDLVVDPSGCT